MSVFRVKLNNMDQGLLDKNPATASPDNLGVAMSPSIQRTIFVTGPKHSQRKLKDGDTFTDSNYWKRFAYPQLPLHEAFIEVVTDDGSVYIDGIESSYPKVYNMTVNAGSVYTDNVVDILGDTGSFATFVQIANNGGTPVKVRLNGVADAIFDLANGETQVFNSGDLNVSKIEFNNTVSGGANTAVQVLISVKSVNLS